jgi:hypothetical protein
MKLELKITNRSRYDDIEVDILVRFALSTVHQVWPIERSPLRLKVTNTRKSWGGYGYIRGYGTDAEGFHACIRIGAPARFVNPRRISYDYKWKDMPVMFLNNYREALVYVTAHELAHNAGKSGRKDGEMRCDFAGQDAVDQYRKQQAVIDGQIADRIRRRDERQSSTEQRHATRAAFVKSAAGRLQKSERMLVYWKRRAKIAKTKISRYQRSVTALRKSAARAVNPPAGSPPPAAPQDSPPSCPLEAAAGYPPVSPPDSVPHCAPQCG